MDCRTKCLPFLTALAVVGAIGINGAAASPLSALFPKKDEEKHAPKVTTFVAWAVCQERQAERPDVSPSQKQNILDVARQYYQKAIEVDANHIPAYTGLARVYMNMNHYDRADETYRRALQRFPKDASLWYSLGLCRCRARNWGAAIVSFQKARELEPENRPVLLTLGFSLARAGRVQDSIAVLSQVMPAAEAHYNVARMMQHVKRDDLCRQQLEQALRLDPGLTAARSLQTGLERGERPSLELQFEDGRP